MKKLIKLTLIAVTLIVITGCVSNPKREIVMKTKICREGDKVWLDGVECAVFYMGKESSVHGVQESIMRAVGEDIDYTELLGVSGLAFRFQVHTKGLCPSSPHAHCGFRCTDRSIEAIPWKTEQIKAKSEEKEKVLAARKAVVDSIERGVPVQYGREEDGIIMGYQKNGEEFICRHSWRGDGKKTFVEKKWPWGILIYTEPKENLPSKKELAKAALQQAVEMAEMEESNGYYLGFKAWDVYIDTLEKLESADEKNQRKAMVGNSWIYECLTSHREKAAEYLRSIAGEFSPEAAAHLKSAAECYEKMSVGILKKDKCVIAIAPLPWSLKKGEKWTSETRKDQVRRLKEALPLEREAIKEIKKALVIINNK